MASTGYTPTLQEVQRTQLTRLDIVHLLNEPNLAQIIESCFVRVLLEIETGTEDYRIFTIKDVGHGLVYRGFSSDPNASTDLYIDLNLPNDLRGINGTAFQLNSVSNSKITQNEYNVWLHSPGPLSGDTSTRLQQRIQRLNSHPVLAPRRAGGLFGLSSTVGPVAGQQQAPSNVGSSATMAPVHNTNLMNTLAPSSTVVVERRGAVSGSSSPPPARSSAMPDVLTTEAATRAVMEDLRESCMVFVNPDHPSHKTSLLRTAERDLADYLEKLREMINTFRQTCVVCMDRAPTVVTLPCKHKVLCRLCASQVNSCPCCRETAVEVFEPVEP
jgi:hypothetical protein